MAVEFANPNFKSHGEVEAMFPRILERIKPKEQRVEPAADSGSGDGDEAADGEAINVAAPLDAVDESPPGTEDGEVSKKERPPEEVMYPEGWETKFECVGELVLERQAEPSDVVEIYQTLSENLQAEIFYVNPSHRGTSILCGITDSALFLESISRMPRVTTWALTHR